MSSFIPTSTAEPEPLSNLSIPAPFDTLWNQLLTHSTGGLVGLVAVRQGEEADAPITDFRYQFLNEVARRDTRDQQPDSKEPIIGAHLSDYFPSIRQTTLWKTYLDVLVTGQPRRVEQHYQIGKRDIQVTQSVSPFGSDGLLLSYTEPSDLQQLTRRLAHQTILLNGVLNSSPNAILVFDAIRDVNQAITDFQVTMTNRQVAQLAQQPDSQLLGQLLSVLYPLKPDQFDRLCELVRTGGSLVIDRYVQQYARWLSISLTTLNDGFVATVQDISEDRHMRRQLEQTVHSLHQSNQSLEQFAYIASHDLQEPLRKIVSFSDVLKTQFSDEMNDAAADLVRRMQLSAGRMRDLVSDLLNYARLSGTRTAFRAVNLNHILAQVMDDLEFSIHDQRAQIQIEPLPTVHGDAVLLHQLFQNLVANALKFQPDSPEAPAPTIQISSRLTSAESVPNSSQEVNTPPQSYVWITVTDNGIGFNEKYLGQIFTIFQRLHGRSHYTGTGMGLAICRKVVDIHGGCITANSAEGKGTTFHIYLPIA
ncbi:sensor histidine kinase [Spirosoma rhododendri]|uniref:histidine kinase n=1 Tax=Spirosoma rhododendri TaxID=2728024 RepID=A0A7L5DUC5_9BACT|nr:ATP-binding protein [Spirosoma rhododendri]QJD81071.1 PAS domain-containing protein [Spirosoma rhododendri]